MLTTKTYKIEIELPEGCDEWWEDLAKLKTKDARKMICTDMDSALQQCGFFSRKIKVTKIIVRKLNI